MLPYPFNLLSVFMSLSLLYTIFLSLSSFVLFSCLFHLLYSTVCLSPSSFVRSFSVPIIPCNDFLSWLSVCLCRKSEYLQMVSLPAWKLAYSLSDQKIHFALRIKGISQLWKEQVFSLSHRFIFRQRTGNILSSRGNVTHIYIYIYISRYVFAGQVLRWPTML